MLKRIFSRNEKIENDVKNIILKSDHNYKMLVNTLKLVNPLGILEKGYSLVTKEEKVVKSSKDLKLHDFLDVRLHDGSIKAQVTEIN